MIFSKILNIILFLPKRIKYEISTHKCLYFYIAREFLISFLVSFAFFFFIFFVNQLLLMLKMVSAEHLTFRIMLELVVLSIPQFLIYTFPFSTLSGASMVIGDLSAKNEILAIRSCGISISHTFVPIVFLSLFISVLAFLSADVVNPWAGRQYKRMYSRIVQNMPSVALKSYSVTNIKNITISVGDVKDNNLSDIIIVDRSKSSETRVISSNKGKIELLDKGRYIYSLTLFDPDIIFTNNKDINDYSLSSASEFSYRIDMSSLIPSFGEPSSNQISVKELKESISSENDNEFKLIKEQELEHNTIELELNNIVSSLSVSKDLFDASDLFEKYTDLKERQKKLNNETFNSFTVKYNLSEIHKRFALSVSCLILVFVAFPISFFKVRYGRLLGFGISIFVAIIYWTMMFFAQARVFYSNVKVAPYMWAPNMLFFLLSLFMLRRLYKS